MGSPSAIVEIGGMDSQRLIAHWNHVRNGRKKILIFSFALARHRRIHPLAPQDRDAGAEFAAWSPRRQSSQARQHAA